MSHALKLDWRELAANCGFTEGPAAAGERIFFTSVNRGLLYGADLTGSGAKPVVETGGGPNGAALDHEGNVWIAQNGGKVVPTKSALPCEPSIQRVAKDGSVTVRARGRFSAPNDCAFGPDGRLWFTDPAGSTEEVNAKPGRLWAHDVATGEIELILDGLAHPNGLAFGLDPDYLFLAETHRKRIIMLSKSREGWRHAGVYFELAVGEPDGMAFDRSGRLWVAAGKGDALVIIEAGGKGSQVALLGPSFPTNLCFAGEDRRSLIVTAPKGGRLLCAMVDEPGLPLFGGA